MRIGLAIGLLLLATAPGGAANKASVDAAFADWIQTTVWPLAEKADVSRSTFDRSLATVKPDWDLPDLIPPGSKAPTPTGAFQAEFSGPGNYLAAKKIDGLAASARKLAKTHAKILAATEKRTGVPAGIILAIWGRESAFGAAAIPKDAIRTLATQAFMGSRKEIFLPELIAALEIVERDHVAPSELKSSWAGAMGQPQFLPSKYLLYATDGDGDGKADIWNSAADTIASIGTYLYQNGWQAGQPWGVEVTYPDNMPCTDEGPEIAYMVSSLGDAGVAHMDGTPVTIDDTGKAAHMLMPAGRLGPSFLVSYNFYTLKSYNESDLYALFVSKVSDRISGRPGIATPWQKLDEFKRGDVRDMQLKLEKMGHDVGGADGLVGWRTRVAIGKWQASNGLAPTCFPTRELMKAIR